VDSAGSRPGEVCCPMRRAAALAAIDYEQTLFSPSEQGFGGNHSLCHGDLDHLEWLLQASQKEHTYATEECYLYQYCGQF
jgi:hypothetical protein